MLFLQFRKVVLQEHQPASPKTIDPANRPGMCLLHGSLSLEVCAPNQETRTADRILLTAVT